MRFVKLFFILQLTIYFSFASNTINYTGSKTCKSCHLEYYTKWQQSDHFKSMAIANKENVLGNFNKKSLNFFKIKSTFFIKDSKYFVNTMDEDKIYKDFEILYTFGYFPLQQYLIKTKKGHIQAFNIAWDSRSKKEGGQKWFHLQENENINPKHTFFWTKHFQNYNSRCAECHNTNLDKNYNPKTNTYNTQWSEINVSCEACHTAGSQHIKDIETNSINKNSLLKTSLPKRSTWKFKKNASTAHITSTFNLEENKTKMINMCGGCHSRRSTLGKTIHGKNYFDQFQLNTLSTQLYEANGQIKDEVFVLGSFLQSKMYKKGVTCLNCHDSHTGKLYTNKQHICFQCHKKQVYNQKTHHGHDIKSKGGQCINCHMMEKVYLGVDKRADHSFMIPDPTASIKYGVPNACTNCHKDKSNTWAKQQLDFIIKNKQNNSSRVSEEYTKINSELRRFNQVSVLDYKKYEDKSLFSNIQIATLLSQFSMVPSKLALDILTKTIYSDNILIKNSSIEAFSPYPVNLKIKYILPLIKEKNLTLSTKVQIALLFLPIKSQLDDSILSQLKNIFAVYLQMLKYNIDTPAGLSSLGIFYYDKNNTDKSINYYKKALKLEPNYIPALINLADIYREQGKEIKSVELLNKAHNIAPNNSAVTHALGLYYIRQKNITKALKYLKLSTQTDNSQPQYDYIYSVALFTYQEKSKAIKFLQESVTHWPNQFNLLLTLVNFMYQSGNLAQAGEYLSTLSKLVPNSPQVQQFIREFQKTK